MRQSFYILSLIAASVFLCGCSDMEVEKQSSLPIVSKALSETTSNFYVNFAAYPEDMHTLPIGIFDSGTGGLTVVEKILTLDRFDNITGESRKDSILDFAGEHFIYLADQANMPYGAYASEGKSDYLKELAVKDAVFLLSDRFFKDDYQKEPTGVKERVKIIIVACNTATAYAYSDIESMLKQSGSGVKVIGVINAGVKAVLDELKIESATRPVAIGIMATPGTITSGAYERTIREELARRNVSIQVDVVNQSSSGLAEAVDNEPDFVSNDAADLRESYRGPVLGTGEDCIKAELFKAYGFDQSGNKLLTRKNRYGKITDIQLNDAANYARFNLVSLVDRHHRSGSTATLRAIVLGCTHYPFLIQTLKETLESLRNYREPDGSFPYRQILADEVTFIDPAVYTAIECYETLRKDGNLAFGIGESRMDSYITVPSSTLSDKVLTEDGRLTYQFKYGREAGSEDISVKAVPFSLRNIDSLNLVRIKNLLPYSYSLIEPKLK